MARSPAPFVTHLRTFLANLQPSITSSQAMKPISYGPSSEQMIKIFSEQPQETKDFCARNFCPLLHFLSISSAPAFPFETSVMFPQLWARDSTRATKMARGSFLFLEVENLWPSCRPLSQHQNIPDCPSPPKNFAGPPPLAALLAPGLCQKEGSEMLVAMHLPVAPAAAPSSPSYNAIIVFN